MYKSKVIYSGIRDYVGWSDKSLTTSLTIRIKRKSNNKEKSSIASTDVALQYFVDILEEFKDVHYPWYKRKQAKNQPTEAYYFLVKNV